MEATWARIHGACSYNIPGQLDSTISSELKYEDGEVIFERIDSNEMLIDESGFATMNDFDSDAQIPVQWPRKCPVCPVPLPNINELYDHFRVVHDEYNSEDEEVGDYYPEARALSEFSDKASEHNSEDAILDDDLYSDLWTNSDSETNIAMANICSVCSFFATTQLDLRDHFQAVHFHNRSATSASVSRDKEMRKFMNEDNLSNSDVETVTPQDVQTRLVEIHRKLSETSQEVQSWLGDVERDVDLFSQEEDVSGEEDICTPVQMHFFRAVEADEKDFMCGYCDCEFAFLDELKVHLDTVHPLSIQVDKAEPTPGMPNHFDAYDTQELDTIIVHRGTSWHINRG